MKKIFIVIILIAVIISISFLAFDYFSQDNTYPTINNTKEPQHLCAIFDRTWNSNTNTCDYMSEVECGFSLGEWEQCKPLDNFCNPNDENCVAPTGCISACYFEDSIRPNSEP